MSIGGWLLRSRTPLTLESGLGYGLGVAGFAAGGRGIHRGTLWLAGKIRPRWAIGREHAAGPREVGRTATHVKSVLATLVPATRKARMWEAFVELYAQISAEASDDFHELFGKEFLRAYEAYIDRLEGER